MVRLFSWLPSTLLVVFPLAVMVLVAYPAFPEPTATFLGALVAYGVWTGVDRLRERSGQPVVDAQADAGARRGVAA